MKVANKFTLSSSKGRSSKCAKSNHRGLLKAMSFLWLGAEEEIRDFESGRRTWGNFVTLQMVGVMQEGMSGVGFGGGALGAKGSPRLTA